MLQTRSSSATARIRASSTRVAAQRPQEHQQAPLLSLRVDRGSLVSLAASASLLLASPAHAAIETYRLAPIEDYAKVVPKGAKAGLEAKLERLELDTGAS